MNEQPDLLQDQAVKKNMNRKSYQGKVRIILMVFGFLLILLIAFGFLWNGFLTLEGKAKSGQEIELQSNSDAVLAKVHVHNSDSVKKGDLLLEFENQDLDLELLSALEKQEKLSSQINMLERESSLAQKRLEGANILLENGVISGRTFEEEELKAQNSLNDLNSAKKELERTCLTVKTLQQKKDSLTVRAPFDGVFLGDMQSKEGTYFRKGETLGIVFNPGEFYLEAELPEERVTRIHLGDRAKITFKGMPGIFSGRVARVSAKIDERIEKVYKTKFVTNTLIDIASPPIGLIPGMRGNARIYPDFKTRFPEAN